MTFSLCTCFKVKGKLLQIYTIAVCVCVCVCSEKFLMMDRGTVRNM